MATVRDSLCELGHLQIPRPKCVGMEFVTVRGTRCGFYRTVNKSVASKYGLMVQQQRHNNGSNSRPAIPKHWMMRFDKKQTTQYTREAGYGGVPTPPPTMGMLMAMEKRNSNGNGTGCGGSIGTGLLLSANSSIPEEPEAEPTPDYEEEEKSKANGVNNKSLDHQKIAIPNGCAPPAPPLSPELRQMLVQKLRGNRQQSSPLEVKKKCRINLLPALSTAPSEFHTSELANTSGNGIDAKRNGIGGGEGRTLVAVQLRKQEVKEVEEKKNNNKENRAVENGTIAVADEQHFLDGNGNTIISVKL